MKNNQDLSGFSHLFLDIDDVLCMSNPIGGYDVLRAYAGTGDGLGVVLPKLFHAPATRVLKSVHDAMDGKVAYVLSSTWRLLFTREQMVEILEGAGAEFVAANMRKGAAWCTPHLPDLDRTHEVGRWLSALDRGQPFAVIDDTYSGSSFAQALASGNGDSWQGRVTLCDEEVGLLPTHFSAILGALRRTRG